MTKPFDVKTVQLSGSNLIEASAGTGKTYSIAILVLRLLIEKRMPIEKILMVTFTKAAVAELEMRIRKFVREAYKFSMGEVIADNTIQEVVGEVTEDRKELLRKAVQSLDNISVMTIHSFCQDVITQYPFETNQSFDAEVMTDTEDLLMYFVNDYWRRELNAMEDLELFNLIKSQLTRDGIREVIVKSLDDKTFVFEPIDSNLIERKLKATTQNLENAEEEYHNHIHDNWEEIKGRELVGAYSGNAIKFIDGCGNALEFEKNFKLKTPAPGYFSKFFPNELNLIEKVQELENEQKELIRLYVTNFYSKLIKQLTKKINAHKQSNTIITYDDLISNVHKAVQDETVNDVLLNRYDAVFIDEFQDTDRKQYDIFGTLFNQSKLIFYIGDPKQSIYGWRKADLQTYQKAKGQVDNNYTMNDNFRSTPKLVEAMNAFFGVDNPFKDENIAYADVQSASTNLGLMTESALEVKPLAIHTFENKDDIHDFVTREILRLLTDNAFLINGEPIQPGDIAVITRKNNEASKIKASLSRLNIPAVSVDEQSVLDSDEARRLSYVLHAILKPSRAWLNRALLNSHFGFDRKSILTLDEEFHLDKFRVFRQEWNQKGIYNMVALLFNTYQVRENCLRQGLIGQRSLSNYMQLTEILHEKALRHRYTPDELLVWLKREKRNKAEDYEQRIESEDNAVKISTIHKAKGLTYKIVFAPFLDMKVKDDVNIKEFRDDKGYKFGFHLDDTQNLLYKEQNEQENRRLIYVALTRAQYKNFITKSNSSYFKESSLNDFMEVKSDEFDVNPEIKEAPAMRYSPLTGTHKFSPRPAPEIEIKNTFGVHSFSSLSRAHYTAPFEKAIMDEAYNDFIFQKLGRGAKVGTALHSIFEHLDFCDESSWEKTLAEASRYYPNVLKEEYSTHFQMLMKHVMTAEFGENERFSLSEIKQSNKQPELEFFFPIEQVNKRAIDELLADEADLSGEADLEGIMTGFVDLVFEHNGKYYILDWKSNHLGNSIENYNQANMETAMKGSNYHLQYTIYTVAVTRYLRQCLPNFDYDTHFGGVIYVFLRGVRHNEKTGIYFKKPPVDVICKLDEALG